MAREATIAQNAFNAKLIQKTTRQGSKWKQTITADGRRVYQRNDLFDPKHVSEWTVKGKKITGTNIERMKAGRAPLGKDGNPINLHHLGQGNDSNIVELTQIQHTKYSNNYISILILLGLILIEMPLKHGRKIIGSLELKK